MVEHVDITDPEIHEPVGASTASAGEVYTADGLGSGSWSTVPNGFEFAGINIKETDAVTVSTIGITQSTLPFSNDDPDNIVTSDATNNRVTLTIAGIYMVWLTVSFSTVAAGDSGLYEFKTALDGTETGFGCAVEMSGSSDTDTVSLSCILTATAGQQLTILVESDEAGNTDDIDIYTATLRVLRVSD